MIKAIIFDFGNVIASFDNGLFLQRISKYTSKSISELNKLIYKKSKLPSQYEQGEIDSNEFYEKVVKLCSLKISQKQFRDAYTQIFTPIPGTIKLINKLKPNYKLGLLSSTSEWDFEFGFKPIIDVSVFDSVTLTYQLGIKKPDPKLFHDTLTKLHVLPNEAVYIDDLTKTIKMANNLGIHGILFTGHDALVDSLNRLGVKIQNPYRPNYKQRVTIVNENDKKIGYKFRDQIKPEDIFRATGLWITNSKGEVLLAKRSFSKKTNPGLWSTAVAGTIEEGETYKQNIIKEAKEELGIIGETFIPYEKTRIRGKHNFFIQWFTFVIDKKAEEFKLQSEEVAEVRWFKKSEIKILLKKRPEMFTSSLPQWVSLFLAK
ncbi:MAG: HAD-IA family hydrolase [Patescibacteria group bacterium]|jgi:putative hydrolase of the HAD superfamily